MIDIKTETAERLERKFSISTGITFALFDAGLIDERTAKRFLVKDDYQSLSPKKGIKEEITDNIAQDYCISFGTAKRYISGCYK